VLESLDIFCLPSRWEGLPFALLEAMMAGLPCVAARVGDVPEALGAAGALVPPDDLESLIEAVRDLVRSPARRRELGAAAHARAVERYSVDRMVAETADVYEGVLAG
jgi:glycosyltransferase involved in cell wall biosynthesis